MGLKRCINKMKKIIISVLCVVLIFVSMPTKSKAGVFQDFIEVVQYIPDAVMILINEYIGEVQGEAYVNVNLKGLNLSTSDEGRIYNFAVSPYEIITNGQQEKYTDKFGNEQVRVNLPILNADFFHIDTTYTSDQTNSNEILRPAISNVYKNLRNFCMVLMLLVLLYIGIKIMISASAEQQSKYKKNLVDWVVGFCLLFIMHYFMVFIMSMNTLVTNMLANGESQSYYVGFCEVDLIGGESLAEGFTSGAAEGTISGGALVGGLKGLATAFFDSSLSWNSFMAKDDTTFSEYHLAEISPVSIDSINDGTVYVDGRPDWGKGGNTKLSAAFVTKSAQDVVCVYRGNIMEYARTMSSIGPRYAVAFTSKGQAKLTGSGTDNDIKKMAYGIFYIALVIETVMFLTIYIKRLIQLAFLTMIAPFVALMYPVDKIGDGKAQSFDAWFKDYFFGVLIQPIHLLIYTVFVSAASQLFTINIIYAIAIYVFMIPAEKYIKKIFGFEKGGSGPAGGGLPSALGHGLGLDALNRYAGIGPGSKGGSGGSGGSSGSKKPKVAKIKGDPSTLAPADPGVPASDGGNAGNANNQNRSNGRRPSSAGNTRQSGANNNRNQAGASGQGTRSPINLSGLTLASGGNRSNRRQATSNEPQASGNVPAASGDNRFKRFIGNGARATASTIGKRVLRGATGGEHSDFSAGGKLVGLAIGKNLAKGAVKAGGMALGATAGLMLSSADAIANGNFDPKKVAGSTIVGLKAGGKQADNLTGSIGNFVDEVRAERAQIDPYYKADLRKDNTRAALASDIAQLEAGERDRYNKLIDNYAPYIDIKSIGDLKALDAIEKDVKAVEGAKPNPISEVDQAKMVKEAYETAKGWRGNLEGDEQEKAYMKEWASDHNWIGDNVDLGNNTTGPRTYRDLMSSNDPALQAMQQQLKEQLRRAKIAKQKFD